VFKFCTKKDETYKDRSLYHDLQSCSGFGDRILDVWAAMTIANLHQPDTDLVIHWSKGHTYTGFVGIYSPKLFSVKKSKFITKPSAGTVTLIKKFSHTQLNEGKGIVPLSCGRQQIILRTGMNWGNSSPKQIHNDLDFYQLCTTITQKNVINTFRDIAKSTTPSSSVIKGIPDDINERVGIHLRLKDKLVSKEMSFDMNERTWQTIKQKANIYIDRCIALGTPMFLCSDDQKYKKILLKQIRSKGGNIVVAKLPFQYRHIPGYAALVDFFALSRCIRIIQMTKYSTFSIAAAMIGGIPLVNFSEGNSKLDNRLNIWKNTLPNLISE
jgi:hypothetical protein